MHRFAGSVPVRGRARPPGKSPCFQALALILRRTASSSLFLLSRQPACLRRLRIPRGARPQPTKSKPMLASSFFSLFPLQPPAHDSRQRNNASNPPEQGLKASEELARSSGDDHTHVERQDVFRATGRVPEKHGERQDRKSTRL